MAESKQNENGELEKEHISQFAIQGLVIAILGLLLVAVLAFAACKLAVWALPH